MDNKGQVWIETVLYTIVILAIIAIVLSFTIPKINEGKDRLVIEQSIDALKNLDKSIYDAGRQTGNVRIVQFSLKRGTLFFNPASKNITLVIDGLTSIYSQPGQTIQDGEVGVTSVEGSKTHSIVLTLTYPESLPFRYEDEMGEVKVNSASLPYTFSIENTGSYVNIKESQ
jgi:type II secretory pathway pseudopilin PulG